MRRLICVAVVLFLGVIAASAFDQNTNQQSDVWEMIFNAAGLVATNDADGDGFSNRDESIAGTDPHSAGSFPWIESASVHGDRITNRFYSAAGKVYQWQGGAEFGSWTHATNVTGSGGEQRVGMHQTGATFFVRYAVSDVDTDGDGLTDWDEQAVGFDPARNRTDRYEQTDSNRVAVMLNAMSTVTVAVLDHAISERWPDAGVFAIRRAGGLKPLSVNVTLGGTATRDTDYTTRPGNSIAIPPGVREVWVEVMPVADEDHGEADETIVLTVTGGVGYVVGAANQGTVTLANETPASPPSPKAAARFLVQAAFGPDQDSTNDVDQIPENVEEVMAMGFEAWIDDQLTRPVGYLQPFAEYAPSIPEFYIDSKVVSWWNRAMGVPGLTPTNAPQLPDPLRQRVAFALSQILVISDRPETLAVEPIGMANYYDLLLTHAFGNYRDLLLGVTLHPCMGFYLSHLQNRKPDPVNNIFPDENYAREIKQLFTIGLWELNQDGTRRLDTNGLPIPTYDNGDITEFARVFTGLSYGPSNAPAFLTGQSNFRVPMKPWDAYHDLDPKTLLNGHVLPARTASVPDTGAATMLDIEAAIDNLFGHTNVAPFIGKQLIQRFVTSNPSTGYVARVAAAFNDNGAGVRGDLAAVIKAILLDDEARDPSFMHDPSFGKMREPFLRVVNLARAFNAAASNGLYEVDDFYLDHYQQVLNAPSVFNFYLPGYLPPGPLARAGLVGPEFQILNAGSAMSGPNYYYGAIQGTLHRWGQADPARQVRLNIVQEQALAAADIDALLRRLDLVLMYGNLSPREFQIIREAVACITPGIDNWQRQRAQLAIYLMITSPECAVAR